MSNYFTTTYIDPEGKVHTGYVKDGRTYKDAEYTQRIDPGTVVSTLDGSYIMTENGGVRLSEYQGNTSPKVSDASAYLNSAKQSALTAQRLRNESAIAELEAGRSGINENYDELAREAYAAYRLGEEGLANGLAASGLYRSGYSDTMRSSSLTSYREDLGQGERDRAKKLAELDSEIARTRAEGESKLSDIENQYALAGLEQYNADRNYQYTLARDAVGDSRYADETAYQRAKDSASSAFEKAAEAAKYGDYSLLASLGIDTSAYQAEKALAERTEQEKLAWSRAMDALSAGDTSLLKALGVDTSAYESEKALAAKTEQEKLAWSRAMDALSAGDTSLLKALGIDTSAYEAEKAFEERTEQEKLAWSEAMNALSAGDTSFLNALGVDTSAYERKRDWTEAIDALSAGDTSLLKALGVDTAYYDDKLASQLATDAYSEGAELSALEQEEAVWYAKSFVSSQLEKGNDYEYITGRLRKMEDDVRKLFGDGFWELYVKTCLSLIPGSMTYSAPVEEPEKTEPTLFTAKEYYTIFEDMLGEHVSNKEVAEILDQTSLSEEEKKEIRLLLGL